MIPYFSLHSFQVGPLTIQVWGLMVALGILLGAHASARLAKRRGQDPGVLWDLAPWCIGAAFVGARLFHFAFYAADALLSDPAAIFRIWETGWSSIGGFLGATVAGVWYLRRRQVDVWAYADTAIFGLPLGLFIGRIGCFLIHDHPGTATDFVLGVEYPDGVVRHDHGLYLSINGLLLFCAFLLLAKKKAPVGAFLVTFLIWYGTVRFFLDFLRVADATYLGLTPAQYASLAMAVGGLVLLRRLPSGGGAD